MSALQDEGEQNKEKQIIMQEEETQFRPESPSAALAPIIQQQKKQQQEGQEEEEEDKEKEKEQKLTSTRLVSIKVTSRDIAISILVLFLKHTATPSRGIFSQIETNNIATVIDRLVNTTIMSEVIKCVQEVIVYLQWAQRRGAFLLSESAKIWECIQLLMPQTASSQVVTTAVTAV